MNKVIIMSAIAAAMLCPALAQAQVPAGAPPYCREYTQTIKIGNVTQKGYGTACMQPDGSWEMQPANAPQGQPAQPNIVYVVRDNRIMMMPPRPFVDIYAVYPYPHHYYHGGYRHW